MDLTLVLALAFGAFFAMALLVVDGVGRRQKDRSLAARIATTHEQQGPSDASDGMGGKLPRPLAAAGTRIASIFGSERFESMLEAANLSVSVGELFGSAVGLGVIAGAVGLIVSKSLVIAAVVALMGGAIPFALVSRARSKRLLKVQAQLPDVLSVLASSLRAGHSFVQALDTASQEVPHPAGHEFARVIAEIRLGRPVDEAMNAMADRIGSEDFRWAVLAVNIQRTVGGNLAEVMDTVAETMREREEIRRQVRTLAAEGKLSIKILTVMPLLLAAYLAKVNPDYISLLFKTNTGLVMMAVATGLLIVGLLWMRRLVKIDV